MRPFFLTFSCLFLFVGQIFASFLDEQLTYSRVRKAYNEKKEIIADRLSELSLRTNDFQVMIKAYKYEQRLKIFVKSGVAAGKWKVYRSYPFCWTSGDLGPKRKQGDYQIPEGYYHLNHFNPYSTFELSLGVSYPNRADRIKSTASDKGGAIYIHGGCATIGCIPIENEPIREVYVLCVLAKSYGQSTIPIHIFPFEYSKEKMEVATRQYPEHASFWENLFEAEIIFGKDSTQAKILIDKSGNYYMP